MEKVVLDKRPCEYHKQGISFCGGYSAKAILEAYGLPTPDHPRDLYPSLVGKITGMAFDIETWPRVFVQRGLQPEVGCAKGQDCLGLLKSYLRQGVPVMVRIGNGYRPNGTYSQWQAKVVGHFITVWGYDDQEKVFYVYDSCVPTERHDHAVPVGNTKRSYEAMSRDWGGAPLLHWYAPPYFYIAVKARSEVERCLRKS